MKKFKSLFLAHLLTLSINLLIYQSRGMLTAWGVIVGISIIQYHKMSPLSKQTIAIVAMVPVLLTAFLISTKIGLSILERADSYRLEIWAGYIRETLKCGWLLGCGYNTHINFITHDGISIPHAHSIYIAHFSKTGVLGIIIMLTLFIGAIRYALKHQLWAGWMFLASSIELMTTSSAIIRSPNERWILIHLPLALIIKHRLEQRNKHS